MSLNIFRSHVNVDTLLITCLLTTKGSMLLCRAHSLSTPSPPPSSHPTQWWTTSFHCLSSSGGRDTAAKFGSDLVSPQGPSINHIVNNFHFFKCLCAVKKD